VSSLAGERPAFAARYPKNPELDALVNAFAHGDFARVRREAPALAEKTDDAAVRDAAHDLRRRLDPSPLALYLVALGFALLAYLFVHYLRA
jgi:hypothetical protein